MKWTIPAKTFMLGEYAAISGAPAIILTTSPCFEMTLVNKPGLQGIHPQSPAGRWWHQQNLSNVGLHWRDPYQGRGGLGASSAQFVGAFLAINYLQKKAFCQQDMLDSYMSVAWSGQGARPSGYDVLAQSLHGCVFIDQQKKSVHSYAWPFADLAFILLHTGQKLATHQHLQELTLPKQVTQLTAIVESAQSAFEQTDDARLIAAINAYHQQLAAMKLVAEHSMAHIKALQRHEHVLAVKGCGAMGADVLLVLILTAKVAEFLNTMPSNLEVIATHESLYSNLS